MVTYFDPATQTGAGLHCQGINDGISAYFPVYFLPLNDSFFFFLIREARDLVYVPPWQCSM